MVKAFQLKIVIKDSKPPIWRRVVVPSGITFTQLSLILNEAMGWSGYHMFEMEFYQLKIRILEDCDDFACGWGGYEYFKANTTFIREFLENNKSFTYIYDMGDYWQHKVTVEKIIEDYKYDYPQVIKYKGDCPPEDCGGIWGYYEKLEIMNNQDHSYYEDITEWMEGGMKTYDIEDVNSILENDYYYIWGKKEQRTQREIQQAMFEGHFGLRATKRDTNKSSLSRELEEQKAMRELQKAINAFVKEKETLEALEEKLKKELMSQETLAGIFHHFEIDTIREIAIEDKKICRVKSLSKKKLTERLIEHMLNPQELERYFLCLNDRQIVQFETAADGRRVFHEEEADGLFQLYTAAYIGLLEDGTYVVPVDVKEAYNRIDTIEFHKKRKKISFLYECLDFIVNLYGIAPISILKQITDQYLFMENMSIEDIKTALFMIPEEYKHYIVNDDLIYSKEYYPDDFGLTIVQADKKYYIPTSDEIKEYSRYGCFPSDSAFKNYLEFLTKQIKLEKEDAISLARMTQDMLRVDSNINEIIYSLEEDELSKMDFGQENRFVDLLVQMNNNTRKITNRGFTPNEMGTGILPKQSNHKVVNIEDACRKKIYANDPCPCGSGLKYKKCCGKKR